MFSEKQIRDFFCESAKSYNFVVAQKELNIKKLRIDVFVIDKEHNPFIIEFKKSRNRHIIGQASQYLALAQSLKEEISQKVNFYQINWQNLKVLLFAPDFDRRDYEAANYEPLKGKVHFFTYSVVKDYREEKVFGLKLTYQGEKNKCPIHLPTESLQKVDLLTAHQQYLDTENKKAKKQYYTLNILPVLEEVQTELYQMFKDKGLYPHISYFSHNDHYLLRLGTDRKHTHRASVAVTFNIDGIVYFGFDLTHSLIEGQILSKEFQKNTKFYAKQITRLRDYQILIPNTGIWFPLPIGGIEEKGIAMLLSAYSPKAMKDCYLIITRDYEGEILSREDIIENLCVEVEVFEFLLKVCQTKSFSK
jgi:hypothetical protein